MAKRMSAAAKAWAEQEAAVLARAVKYSIELRISPTEVWSAKTESSVSAVKIAKHFNLQSQYGRRAVIYGINPEGRAAFMAY